MNKEWSEKNKKIQYMRKMRKTVICGGAIICLLLCMVGCSRHPSQEEIEEFVVANIPEASTFVDDYVRQTKNGMEYHYTFKSDSRDLEFDVVSSKGTGGYQISEYFSLGRQNYYLEKMRPFLASCENSRMYKTPDKPDVSTKLYMDNSSDAKRIAVVLAKCNEIVTEEWEYQPGADLTKDDVLGIAFNCYPELSDKKVGSYYLNGMDDEEEIYKKLEAMLIAQK